MLPEIVMGRAMILDQGSLSFSGEPPEDQAFLVLKLADFWLISGPNLGILLELFIAKC